MGARRHEVWASLVWMFLVAASARAAVDWASVDTAFGFAGKVLPGEVHRFGWPRRDLEVVVDGVKVEPALALGSWAGLVASGTADRVLAMGDLVLKDSEVEGVVDALQSAGFEVTAIHNHLLGETPHVSYVHFMAHSEPLAIARGLKAALAKSATPEPAPAQVEPTQAEQAAFAAVQQALGRNGTQAGHVLQIGVPRAERVEDHGMELPASLGLSTAINVQAVGAKVAATGDFVLVASEVDAVIREPRAHGIAVTALHSHMLTETPRLFFMHFWALDTPQRVGAGLRAALSKVNVKPG